jgi:transposase
LDVHLILDNYGTHKTVLIRRWLARRPRFHAPFTPTSASWLNLVERWFAALTQKQIKRSPCEHAVSGSRDPPVHRGHQRSAPTVCLDQDSR